MAFQEIGHGIGIGCNDRSETALEQAETALERRSKHAGTIWMPVQVVPACFGTAFQPCSNAVSERSLQINILVPALPAQKSLILAVF